MGSNFLIDDKLKSLPREAFLRFRGLFVGFSSALNGIEGNSELMKALLSLSKYKLRMLSPFGLTQKNEKLKAVENHTRKYYTDIYW